MAFDSSGVDQHSSDLQSQQQLPFSLPPYPQMILEAIEALNDKNGSNKTTIAKQIESTQQSVPPSHATLLNYHLNQMKKTGQLVMVKNNYMKPDPNGPPKRGRGRPPKQKSQEESDAAPTATVTAAVVSSDPPRSRGRPPKPKDPSEPSVQPKEKNTGGSGRPRGRPPKKAKTDSETGSASAASETESAAAPPAQPTGERRGRGRPPKAKTVVAPVGC